MPPKKPAAPKKGRTPTHEADPEVVKRLIEAIKAGNYVDTACDYAGIDDATYYRWMKRGREESARIAAGSAPDPAETPYRDICEAVKRARAEATVRNVMLIQTAARAGTWQAAAWWLERTQPDRYGRRIATEVSGPDKGPISVVTVSPEELDKRIAVLLGEETEDTA